MVTSLLLVAGLSACGGSGGGVARTSAGPTLGTPPASHTCPTAAKVNSALGTTLPKPTGVSGGSGGLPAGATAVVCNYHATSYNVIIELISNISPSDITMFSNKFPVAFTKVSGVGDQARAFRQTLSGGKINEGVVATKGNFTVLIVATYTPASLSQVESLVRSLL